MRYIDTDIQADTDKDRQNTNKQRYRHKQTDLGRQDTESNRKKER